MNKSTNQQYGDKVPGAVGARAKRPVPVVVGAGDTVLSILHALFFVLPSPSAADDDRNRGTSRGSRVWRAPAELRACVDRGTTPKNPPFEHASWPHMSVNSRHGNFCSWYMQ